ncbi:hypothetical protein SANTM175S_08772 [Streptomyces antimycoticus]
MKAGMWKVYTTMYSASAVRLESVSGSQEWAIATSTIARYFALSKNASRCLGFCPAGALGALGAGGVDGCCPGSSARGVGGVGAASWGRGVR